MIKRAVALCEGKIIGIETIYTIIDGKQINIQNKVEELRAKGRDNKLFCACGCGANLVLVAGDRNLREQHFRIKNNNPNVKCDYVNESRTSIDSKVVLKCWLDDKLHADDLEMRVQIHDVDYIDRKYEFSFLSMENKIAINYCNKRANLSDEKIEILQSNSKGINVIHIVDDTNDYFSLQYPEMMMKLQNAQGYCLLLKIEGNDYYRAKLRITYYIKTKEGLWKNIHVTEGLLSDYSIVNGALTLRGNTIMHLKEMAVKKYYFDRRQEEIRREEEKRFREEQERIAKEQLEKERIQREKELEEWREQQAKKQAEQKIKEAEEARKKEEFEKRRQEEEKKRLIELLNQQETIVYDSQNRRVIRCERCGKIGYEGQFFIFGGKGRVNLGICTNCE